MVFIVHHLNFNMDFYTNRRNIHIGRSMPFHSPLRGELAYEYVMSPLLSTEWNKQNVLLFSIQLAKINRRLKPS